MAVADSMRAALRGIWPALIAGPAALLLYAATLAPGLTWAHHGSDGGDFLAAALVGGAPHPSGYPTYEILLRAATLLPGEPARWGNWLSAACVALGIGVFAALAYQVLAGTIWRGPVALSAALCLAASPALWSQAVITEVHGLNFLLIVTLMALLWMWGRGSWRWWPALTGLTFGLSLGNHLTTLLLIPAAADWLWRTRRGKADRRREWLMAAAATALGLTVYLYLPFAAAADPPVNWGDPEHAAPIPRSGLRADLPAAGVRREPERASRQDRGLGQRARAGSSAEDPGPR